jgi:hypothetical protein
VDCDLQWDSGSSLRASQARLGRTLIVDAISAQGTLILGRLKSPGRTFEFWRDQIKIRGRLIGVGNGVVVPRLNVDGLPE